MPDRHRRYDVIVIGAGQAGLAIGYYLRRTNCSFVLLDAEPCPGGSWQHTWDALRLFSPARWSSLPGWLMPGGTEYYPTRDHVIDYLRRYEARYDLPVERPVHVATVRRENSVFVLETDRGPWQARAVVSATGTQRAPHVPSYPGQDRFAGHQLHSSAYRSPLWLAGQRVLVVGGGNSGAQIQAEVSQVAEATWVTREPPRFLPDDVDGRVLFEQATTYYRARQQGQPTTPWDALGDIVMVPSVRAARERGDLEAVRLFDRFIEQDVVWPDGREEGIDAVIWCTGFDAALAPLASLELQDAQGHIATEGTRAVDMPNLWLVGYGTWSGFASATLIGVGRSARQTVQEITEAMTPTAA